MLHSNPANSQPDASASWRTGWRYWSPSAITALGARPAISRSIAGVPNAAQTEAISNLVDWLLTVACLTRRGVLPAKTQAADAIADPQAASYADDPDVADAVERLRRLGVAVWWRPGRGDIAIELWFVVMT